MIVTIGLIVTLISVFYLYLIWNLNYWKKRNVPGPKPAVLFGNLPSMLNQKTHIAYEIDQIYKDFRDEPTVGIFSITTPQLMIKDPELVKDVLIKNFKSFSVNEFSDIVDKKSDPLMGRNPFVLVGDEWKDSRAEITPAFTTARIKALGPLIDEVCIRMTNYIKKHDDEHPGESLDTKELMSKYTTDVVANCIFALDAESFTTENPAIREMGRNIMNFSLSMKIALAFSALFPALRKFYKFNIVPKHIEQFFIRIMTEAIKHRKSNNIQRVDYLDHLIQLESKKQITELDMAGHGVSFFVDGFETSSISLSYCLYDIAANKDVQEKLRNEITEVVNSKNGLSYENISEMEYLDQVVNESLRIHPIGANMTKRCIETIEITDSKDRKHKVEAGISVTIPLYSLQLDSDHFTDPYTFNPERFNPENGGTKAYKDKGVFLPFSDGPRKCLGMKFALAQIKRGIVEIINNFDLSVNAKTQEPFVINPKEFMILPIGGIWLDYKPRAN